MYAVPVIEVKTPSYELPLPAMLSGEMHYTLYGLPIPIEFWEARPDFCGISKPLIEALRLMFGSRRVLLRLLGSQEHPEKSIDELVAIILQLGHDRYDPGRQGDCYENVENKAIDLFALDIQLGQALGEDGEIQVTHALQSMYTYPLHFKGHPVRVDIVIVYAFDHLEMVPHSYEGRPEEKSDGYVFRDQEQKPEALLAIIKLL